MAPWRPVMYQGSGESAIPGPRPAESPSAKSVIERNNSRRPRTREVRGLEGFAPDSRLREAAKSLQTCVSFWFPRPICFDVGQSGPRVVSFGIDRITLDNNSYRA